LGWVATEDSTDHALLIEWTTRDDVVARAIVYSRELHTDAGNTIGRLADAGLYVSHSKTDREAFISYLSPLFIDNPVYPKITLVKQRGWQWINGDLVFAHEERVISKNPKLKAIPAESGMRLHKTSGTLSEWQQRVGNPFGKHRLGRFAIAIALSGPLHFFLPGLMSAIFHFASETSVGKSLLLSGAASVYGHGGENGGYIQSYSATANALEVRAGLYNDTVLCINELGVADADSFGKLIYKLGGGVARDRLTPSAKLKPQAVWSTPILSSGEIGLQDKLLEGRGRNRATGGQLVRMLEIDVDQRGTGTFGIFDGLKTTLEANELADKLKETTAQYYGTAGIAFIEELLKQQDPGAMVRTHVDQFMARVKPETKTNKPEVLRVARQFAVVHAA
jgi:uncharacterized protein (DUF927 family)